MRATQSPWAERPLFGKPGLPPRRGPGFTNDGRSVLFGGGARAAQRPGTAPGAAWSRGAHDEWRPWTTSAGRLMETHGKRRVEAAGRPAPGAARARLDTRITP